VARHRRSRTRTSRIRGPYSPFQALNPLNQVADDGVPLPDFLLEQFDCRLARLGVGGH
jgi:hypothetical protein